MYIDGKWYSETELIDYIGRLKLEITELKDENKILREALAGHGEEEYD